MIQSMMWELVERWTKRSKEPPPLDLRALEERIPGSWVTMCELGIQANREAAMKHDEELRRRHGRDAVTPYIQGDDGYLRPMTTTEALRHCNTPDTKGLETSDGTEHNTKVHQTPRKSFGQTANT